MKKNNFELIEQYQAEGKLFDYSEKESNKYDAFIEKTYGKIVDRFHPHTQQGVKIEILVIAPTEEQPFYRLVTKGAGSFKMNMPYRNTKDDTDRAEYVINLPKNWNFDSSEEKWTWPFKLLYEIALAPYYYDFVFGYGHTFAKEEPFAPDSEMNSAILMETYNKKDKFVKPFKLAFGKKISFHQLYLLYPEELEVYQKNNDLSELFSKFDPDEFTFVTDVKRKNWCK